MNFSYLKWDSDFFKKKTGKLLLTSNDDIDDLSNYLEFLKNENYQLIYVFVPDCKYELSLDCLNQFNGKLVDTKYVFEKQVSQIYDFKSDRIFAWNNDLSIKSLYDLAIQSGEFSRYKIDEKIGVSYFVNLYHIWVDNSINGSIANEIFVYIENYQIVGFVTLRYFFEKVTIGLIAVDESKRGKHLGTSLINYVENHVAKLGVKYMEVATQKNNSIACSFYKKNNMSLKDKTDIYHFWF